MRRVGKTPEAKMKHKADSALQAWAVKQFPKCELCPSPSQCGHHIVEKSRSSRLRYEEENIVALCRICHSKVHNQIFGRVGNNILRSYNLLDRIINARGGKKWLDALEAKGRELVKTNVTYYQIALEKYNRKIDELNGNQTC